MTFNQEEFVSESERLEQILKFTRNTEWSLHSEHAQRSSENYYSAIRLAFELDLITNSDLAHHLDVSLPTIERWRKGKNAPHHLLRPFVYRYLLEKGRDELVMNLSDSDPKPHPEEDEANVHNLLFRGGSIRSFLILKTDSGIKYWHQAGGLACSQKVIEGILVPWEVDLHGYISITYNKYLLTKEDADQLDKHLECQGDGKYNEFCVDRELLEDSCESWINVTLETPSNINKAVLVWENSD